MASFGQGVLLLLSSLAVAVLVHAGKYCCGLLSPSERLWLETQAILCHWQTWNWTVSLVMWRWCGLRTGPRLTHHSFVWVTVSPPATRPGRLSSAQASIAVTSGGWCVKIRPAGSVVFSTVLPPCLSLSQVTGDLMLYTNDLTYISSDQSHILPFSHPVVCAYERWVLYYLNIK